MRDAAVVSNGWEGADIGDNLVVLPPPVFFPWGTKGGLGGDFFLRTTRQFSAYLALAHDSGKMGGGPEGRGGRRRVLHPIPPSFCCQIVVLLPREDEKGSKNTCVCLGRSGMHVKKCAAVFLLFFLVACS